MGIDDNSTTQQESVQWQSTSVIVETLEMLGANVSYYLPNRFKDGYGPNVDVYRQKIEEGIELILTVDNGVAGHEAIDYANQQGISDEEIGTDEIFDKYFENNIITIIDNLKARA